jgi:hypothetical protein
MKSQIVGLTEFNTKMDVGIGNKLLKIMVTHKSTGAVGSYLTRPTLRMTQSGVAYIGRDLIFL